MRNRSIIVAVSSLLAASLLAALPATAGSDGRVREYVVLYEDGAALADARASIRALGGTIVEEIAQIGLAKVRTRDAGFASAASADSALVGAVRNRIIGFAEPALREKVDDVESLIEARGAAQTPTVVPGAEPLASLQWGMQMIDATVDGSYAVKLGRPAVLVGIIDTGIDASHPEFVGNFSKDLSRNFTTDIPLIDGACEEDPDGSCEDPANVDEAGHGTHVAGIVGAGINRLGVAGVAPGVTLVNLRAGQDSGFFFLFETLEAYVYAGDNGIDVVNMSFFTDPWQFNCPNNPADSPEAQAEQQLIVQASNEALTYAFDHGVTLVSSSGNSHLDLGNPTFDGISPDFPPGSEYERTIDNSCLDIPTEGDHVMSINALGPSGRKAYYSNYGVEQSTVAAPGGDRRDFFGTPQYNTPETRILSSYPYAVAVSDGLIDPSMNVLNPLAVVNCRSDALPRKRNCGVYVYLQGTSMASPHVTGVAALIVGAHGSGSGAAFGLDPTTVEQILRDTATDTDDFFAAMGEDWRDFCPEPPTLFVYPDLIGADPNVPFEALCVGDADFNGFYGDGIVNALAAVS
jgi:lantibiotic leader peptide-processing serine protease